MSSSPPPPLPVPDLLHLSPRVEHDARAVYELLDLAFLGREVAAELDRRLAEGPSEGFDPDLFAGDLFLDELVRRGFTVTAGGRRHPVHLALVRRVLASPPTDVAEVRFRQEVLRELDREPRLTGAAERLYLELGKLIAMLKAPEHAAQLDPIVHRLDVLETAKAAIDLMATGFAGATSGLARLAAAGEAIHATEEYAALAAVLDHHARLATLHLAVDVGADGRLHRVEVTGVDENRANRHHRGPLRRWLGRLGVLLATGSWPSQRDLFGRLLHRVFQDLEHALVPLVGVAGQLEVYLGSRGFRDLARHAGLATCLAGVDTDGPTRFDRLWNPLLLLAGTPPVPTDLACAHRDTTTVLTGPNSGGKTRFLQSVAFAQLLGQSGLYLPAAAADLRVVRGLFVSLVERETADQAEGRLGRELLRIRRLFATLGSPSMVVLDELCSGTNPEEGVEIFDLVLRLLDRLRAVAFLSTHFLAYARTLERDHPIASLELLQAEVDAESRPTYQFVPGVAATSLAAATAKRLGVSFEELARLVDERRRDA